MKARWFSLILLAAVTAAGASVAQNSTNRVGAQTDWSIFVENNPTQCWVVSAPKETVNTREGRVVAVNRGDIYMFVSFWPGSDQMGEVSFIGGYPFADGSTVTLTIGESEFELFTDGETAWAASPEDDRQIATALKRGAEATVVGRSSRGTVTKDTFSLIGFTAAYEDAQKRCNS
jgi:hypothetical protein